MNTSALHVDTRREHALALLAYPILGGTAVAGSWLQLQKANVQGHLADEAKYSTDWVIQADGETIGYLDSEEKLQWRGGPWPWSFVNIAKHPMKHWEHGSFSGRETNKLRSFREKPELSFWVGMRMDYAAAMVIRASTLFEHASDYLQPTRYSDAPLPVFRLDRSFGLFCDTPEAFSQIIIDAYLETKHANH
jgi:hypothetical protein